MWDHFNLIGFFFAFRYTTIDNRLDVVIERELLFYFYFSP